MNYYDQYGWFTASEISSRSTDIAPPIASETTTPGEPRANWTGHQWLVLDYVAPPPAPVIVPSAVTMRQARIVLALQPSPDPAFPHLLAYITAQFDALPEPDKTVAQITWEYSTEVQRSNPLIAQMQSMIGFTDQQIDQMFIQAATL